MPSASAGFVWWVIAALVAAAVMLSQPAAALPIGIILVLGALYANPGFTAQIGGI